MSKADLGPTGDSQNLSDDGTLGDGRSEGRPLSDKEENAFVPALPPVLKPPAIPSPPTLKTSSPAVAPADEVPPENMNVPVVDNIGPSSVDWSKSLQRPSFSLVGNHELLPNSTVDDSMRHSGGQPLLPDPMSAVDPAVIQIVADDDADEFPLRSALRSAKPWFLSSVVNIAAIVILALIPILMTSGGELVLELSRMDAPDAQPDPQIIDDAKLVEPAVEAFLPAAGELEIVELPEFQSELPDLENLKIAMPEGLGMPAIGSMLSGRQEGTKEGLLAAYGGSAATENAVLNGLDWLHRHQGADGMWSLTGRQKDGSYADGGSEENKNAATAMAMLAFQGFGQTHQDGPIEKFRHSLARAAKSLRKRQTKDGGFTRNVPSHHHLYTQALCTLALCELYAMSKDEKLREPAERAIGYLVKSQDAAGGWRYVFGSDSDLSVSGWVMMALQSARMAGIHVPQETLYRFEEFLDSVAVDGGSRYAYTPNGGAKLSMTAEGLLCRQYLGWPQDNSNLLQGVQWLGENGIATSGNSSDFYYWYYATQVLHNIEGEAWTDWNAVMSRALPDRQETKGPERGSWSPEKDSWGQRAGRLYTTSLAIYMLEVYYRHLPIYSIDMTGR